MSVSISPDGKHIMSGSEDNTIWVWDVDFLNWHQPLKAPAICFSSNLTHALHSAFSFLQDSKTLAPFGPNEEEWVVGPEGQLLFWIPLNFHPVVYAPGNMLVIPNNALQLDLNHVVAVYPQLCACVSRARQSGGEHYATTKPEGH
jgi:hypothetical protein